MRRILTHIATIRRFRLATLMLCGALLTLTTALHAADRVWTDRSGNLLKAELSGVKDGKVMLRQDRKRLAIPLPQFILDDRDEIISQFRKRDQQELIEQLVDAANEEPLGGLKPNERITSFYELPVPSPQLLRTPEPRHWSDLTGRRTFARFRGVIAPAHVQLQRLDLPAESATTTMPLAILSREDIEHVRKLLQDDRDATIFPGQPTTDLTEDLAAAGFRTWTDRHGHKQTARFVKWLGDDVTLALPVTASDNAATDDEPVSTPITIAESSDSEEVSDTPADALPVGEGSPEATPAAPLERPILIPLAGLSIADQQLVRTHEEGRIYERPAPPKPVTPQPPPAAETTPPESESESTANTTDEQNSTQQNGSVTVAQPATGGDVFGMQLPLWLKIAIGAGLLLFVGTWFRRQMA